MGCWQERRQGRHGVQRRFDTGVVMSDLGLILYVGKKVYDGQWLNDVIHGTGVFLWADQSAQHDDVYEGEFADGNIHGSGVYHFANGDSYSGQFVNGLKSGIAYEFVFL